MYELKNEEKIIESAKKNNADLVITNYRVSYQIKNKYTSIMLDEISSIELKKQVEYKFIWFGLLSIFLGLLLKSLSQFGLDSYSIYFFFIAFVFYIIYYATQKTGILITSNCGVKILVETKGKATIQSFSVIKEIEQARLEFLKEYKS